MTTSRAFPLSTSSPTSSVQFNFIKNTAHQALNMLFGRLIDYVESHTNSPFDEVAKACSSS